jgi:DNA polymerase-3 subunit delta
VPVHILHGPDEFRASEALGDLRRALDGDGMLETNTSTLEGRGLKADLLLTHIAAAPFLGAARLVIVDGLLTATGARRGAADPWQPLIEFVPQMPETNHLVLREPPPREWGRGGIGRSPLLRALRELPNVTVTEFAELRTYARGGASEVAQWLDQRAERLGVALEPKALDALVDLVGAGLRTLANELDKLARYVAGDASATAAAAAGAGGGTPRAITADDVRLLTPLAREERIFDLVDAVVEGHDARALRTLRRMLEDGSESPVRIQSMVARQVRMIVRATELLAAGASQDDIASATGARGFPLTKLMRQARATTAPAAELALHAIEESDHAVKTGRLDEALAIELLVCRLAEIAKPERAAAR